MVQAQMAMNIVNYGIESGNSYGKARCPECPVTALFLSLEVLLQGSSCLPPLPPPTISELELPPIWEEWRRGCSEL